MTEKNIFIFDQNKCVACEACVVACMNENGFQSSERWRNVLHSQKYHHPLSALFYLSLSCNQCDEAPCMINCPAMAYSRDENTGAVIHDPDKCIGCKYCTWSCPYDAPKFNPKLGIIEKCTFCNHRIEEGLKPACASLCPVGALDFEKLEFSREESILSNPVQIDTGSKLKIIKLRKKTGPEQDMSIFKKTEQKKEYASVDKKISALKEWPLVIFTLISAFAFSIYASEITNSFEIFKKHIFIGIGSISVALTFLHLGKKKRSWRAILNLKNSWISREIATLIFFYLVVFIDFYIYDLPDLIGIGFGLIFLYSVDMLYRLATWSWHSKVHSAQTLLIAFTMTFLIKEQLIILAVIIFVRMLLYVFRKYYTKEKDIFITIIRLLFLSLPAVLIYLDSDIIFAMILLVIGEIIDRIEFYNGLNVPDPKEEFIY